MKWFEWNRARFPYLTGNVSIHSRLAPSLGGFVKSLLADEAIYRPTYTGTGVVTLESSLGGYHVLDLHGESWILERGALLGLRGKRRRRIITGNT